MKVIKNGFVNERLGIELDVYVIGGKEWFKDSDVAMFLEYRDSYNMKRTIDLLEENSIPRITRNGYEAHYINEVAMYEAVLKIRNSDTDNVKQRRYNKAREFQKWVFSEVLPSIRKNNYYVDEKNINVNQISKLENTVKRLVTEKAMLHEIVYDMADATTMSFTEASSKLFGKDAKYLKEMLIKHKFLSKDGNKVLKKEAEFITPSGKREVMRLFVHTNVEKCRKDEDIKYNKVTNFGYMYLKKHFNIRGLSDFSINKNEISIDEQLKLC
ncbi:MAG: BRO-N domain-containing protein [Fusobacteriaceae bacterium]